MEHAPSLKIHIIGSVGSGKTTLARKLSKKYSIPHYELDNVVWERRDSGDDRRRTEQERDHYLNNLTQSNAWVIEGVHYEWVSSSLKAADYIIFLDVEYKTRLHRIIRRFVLQKIGIERANYKPNLHIFKKMFKWNADFETRMKPAMEEMLHIHQDKVIRVGNGKDI
ncbi:AAA family ATPase [Pontibacillus yanchengensis]|uniref:AAA family ATPase n=1 Tax=Pontibacillus yanchengensis TaxID=462910 RepID=A0ACC7VLX4_9BACI|nr:AAA family ATPase [Pontibacillus yanchengensis]MYL55029.1 AAA family ATPase [Pontibacillus yanchengensis]